ncbi:hypothetical protein [Peribacillus sp. NJ4]|uniref:hypothetical protein n=1 Tax=Peribacillus sp. NJ4 TaxID=3055862 RepID=UPI0025A29DC2|nr:hypothetical protein [Peribacillus sp. NJ4]
MDVFNVNVDISRKTIFGSENGKENRWRYGLVTTYGTRFLGKGNNKKYRLPNGGIDVVLIYISLQMNDFICSSSFLY